MAYLSQRFVKLGFEIDAYFALAVKEFGSAWRILEESLPHDGAQAPPFLH